LGHLGDGLEIAFFGRAVPVAYVSSFGAKRMWLSGNQNDASDPNRTAFGEGVLSLSPSSERASQRRKHLSAQLKEVYLCKFDCSDLGRDHE
jgi:hypothetical protein